MLLLAACLLRTYMTAHTQTPMPMKADRSPPTMPPTLAPFSGTAEMNKKSYIINQQTLIRLMYLLSRFKIISLSANGIYKTLLEGKYVSIM